MKPEFVELKTKDGLTLPGLLYRGKKDKAVVVYLHGNGSSSVFYDEVENHPLASALAKKNISTLYFNNRGAHIIKKLNVRRGKKDERKRFGMAYEKIKECEHSLEGDDLLQVKVLEYYDDIVLLNCDKYKICSFYTQAANSFDAENNFKFHFMLNGIRCPYILNISPN